MKAVMGVMLIAVLLLGSVSYGAYLDAEGGAGGNTVRASDGNVSAWMTSATAPDGLWGRRMGFANNPTGALGTPDNDIFEASGTGSDREDGVQIITSISGLIPGSVYKVDVVYWSSTSQNWSIRAGFDSSVPLFYDRLGADGATAGTATGKTEGDRAELSGLVGYTTADANGEIKIYIDDKPSNASQGGWYDRTWYDGLLYEKFSVASDPVPADGATDLPVDTDLEWTILESKVEYIDLYFGPENEPNLVSKPEYKVLDYAAKTFSFDPGTLDYETPYYWRIDTYEPNTLPGGTGYMKAVGPVWSFTTVQADPVIQAVEPAVVAVDAGADAIFTVTGTSIDSYQWYRIGEGADEMLTDGAKYSGTTTDTLSVYDVQAADEGYFYCVGSNSLGSVSNRDTGAGRLMLRRLTSHWAFETLTAGVTPDAVDGYSMTVLNNGPGSSLPTLGAGLPELAPDAGSLQFDNSSSNDPNTWGQYALVDAGAADYADLTLSLWVYWNGGGNWQRIIDFGNDTTQYMFLTPNHGGECRFALNSGGGEQLLATGPLTAGEWTFVAVTLDGDTGRLYVNGELRATNTAMTIDPVDFRPAVNYVGKSQYEADPYFNGMLDDLKIYNYARTTRQIAKDYLALRGEWICDGEAAELTFDFNDDCRVDLLDFALLAEEWLGTNRIYLND